MVQNRPRVALASLLELAGSSTQSQSTRTQPSQSLADICPKA